jgi:primosomal protein N' (replication factor Y)
LEPELWNARNRPLSADSAVPQFVSVAVNIPALDLLTYRIPAGTEVPPRGARVLVSVGSRQVTGCVVNTAVEAPADIDVRELDAILDDEPFLPGRILDLALWIADYYVASPGSAVAAAWPPLVTVQSQRRVAITERGRAQLEQSLAQRGAALAVLRALADGASFSVRELESRVGEGATLGHVLGTLARDGLVSFGRELQGRTSGFKWSRLVTLTAAGQEVVQVASNGRVRESAADVRLGERQREAMEMLGGSPEGLDTRALGDRGVTSDTLRRLRAKGWISVRTERDDRNPLAGVSTTATESVTSRELTVEQAEAISRLRPRLEAGAFHVTVLHGVTGSGKTELYLRLSATAVQHGRQVLMLVPEIALAPAVASAFRHAFGARVAIQHSGLSDGERHDQWHRIRSDEVSIVVGTRSAVFAPLERLGLVIVDEEHDTSYKQDETPRYNARDVAIVRAQREGALVVLGSATPSLESYRHAVEGRYELVTLERRVLDRPLAAVQIVNMRDELATQGPDAVISAALADALRARIARGEQTLLLLNRRGFATAVFCRQCGATADCPNCSVSLTVHHERSGPRGRCHYCNYSVAVPKACSACAAPYVEHVGFGTARVEAEVGRLLPGVRIARLDRDTVSKKGAIQKLLARVADRSVDVLVGTQMIAKGHDFPSVTLVGVISADVGLGLPDFRAAERTFQLLTQVAGRAGRGETAGEAVIQTLFPEHYSIQLACRQDYRAFFEHELRFRKAMRYPPAVSLVNIVLRGRSFGQAMTAGADFVAALRQRTDDAFRVLGPAPAPLGRVRGEYRAQVLLKGASRGAMRRAIKDALASNAALQRRVTVDVDPLSMM